MVTFEHNNSGDKQEWTHPPLFSDNDQNGDISHPSESIPLNQSETTSALLHMSKEQLEDEYFRVIGHKAKYYTTEDADELRRALSRPDEEIKRIARIIIEENLSGRTQNHGA